MVVVKYDRKPLSNKTLFAFTKPFGVLREHLVLKNKVSKSECLGGPKSLILELVGSELDISVTGLSGDGQS